MSENSQELIRQYKKNDTEIKRLAEVRHEEREKYSEEIRKIDHSYYEAVRKLERKRDEAADFISSVETQLEEVTATRIENLNKVIAKVKRIKAFLNTDTSRNLEIDDDKAKPNGHWREDDYFEPLGYLINDDFLKVKLYIVENDRPKNKYSLEAIGTCAFREQLISLHYGYGTILNTMNMGLSIAQAFEHLPTVEAIKQYVEKRKDDLIQRCKGNYDEVKTEYLEAIANYSLEDFKELEGEANR